MSDRINKKTCKYVVIDVDTYEEVLEFVNRSGGGSFPSFEYEARPVIGDLVATPNLLPCTTPEEVIVDILSDHNDNFDTIERCTLYKQAMTVIRKYVWSLC